MPKSNIRKDDTALSNGIHNSAIYCRSDCLSPYSELELTPLCEGAQRKRSGKQE